MDNYFEQDKTMVVNELISIKSKLSKVLSDDVTKDQAMSIIRDCIKGVNVLGVALSHIDNVDVSNADDTSKLGMTALKASINTFCEDIDQSINDTTWIEDIDTFAQKQKTAVDDIIKSVQGVDLSPADKAYVESQIEAMKQMTPPEGADEWVVRKMRNDMLLKGLKSHLHYMLVQSAEL